MIATVSEQEYLGNARADIGPTPLLDPTPLFTMASLREVENAAQDAAQEAADLLASGERDEAVLRLVVALIHTDTADRLEKKATLA